MKIKIKIRKENNKELILLTILTSYLIEFLVFISFFGFLQSFIIYIYTLQLKYLGFLSLSQLYLAFLIFISNPPILQSCFLFVNSYSCPTNVIAVFHSLSYVGTAMGRYSNMVLIMSLLIFFFSTNITWMLLVLAFIANVSNSIIKLVMCFFSCLNVLILYQHLLLFSCC